jgi:hypothetical protein
VGQFAPKYHGQFAPKQWVSLRRNGVVSFIIISRKGLNFKESDRHGNFLPKTMFWNHQKEIQKYPVKELADPYDRKRMLASMEKGNKVNVTILKDGQELKAVVAANPRMQRFDFYDENGQTLMVRQVEKQKIAQTNKLSLSTAETAKLDPGKDLKQDQKLNQQEAVTGEQKNNTGQHKKQGIHI